MENQEQPQPEQLQKINPLTAIAAMLIILGLVYVSSQANLFKWFDSSGESHAQDDGLPVVVEHMAMTDGRVSAPAGFPAEIPVEKETILESFTTDFNEWKGKQLSVSYQSTSTVAEKYAEYESYMKDASYEITAGIGTNGIRTLFGVKNGTNLSVAISGADGQTRVQLAYLIKSR